MGILSNTVSVFSDGSLSVQPAQVSTRPPLWRIKHWREVGRVEGSSRPEMWPLFPNHYVDFRRDYQLRSKDLNPLITPIKWTKVYDTGVWITNFNGFGDENDPRVNYVTGENIGAPLPKCEMLNCGGNVVTGEVVGTNLKVQVLDGLGVAPSADWLNERPWFVVTAINWYYPDGNVGGFPMGALPDGTFVPIRHPFIGDPGRYPSITIPLSCVERWDREFIPDPYRFY